jgi:hypothetical protein
MSDEPGLVTEKDSARVWSTPKPVVGQHSDWMVDGVKSGSNARMSLDFNYAV